MKQRPGTLLGSAPGPSLEVLIRSVQGRTQEAAFSAGTWMRLQTTLGETLRVNSEE